MRRSLTALALSPLVLAPLGVTPPAGAAAAQHFTITEALDFQNDSYTFTATGPLCPSGTFEDDVTKTTGFQSQKHVVLFIDTVYTCDDGSGTFTMHKHVDFWFSKEGLPSNGPVKLTGGTGDYEGLAGHGHAVGSRPNDEDHGVGLITGKVVHP
jgi:hypothetical protein